MRTSSGSDVLLHNVTLDVVRVEMLVDTGKVIGVSVDFRAWVAGEELRGRREISFDASTRNIENFANSITSVIAAYLRDVHNEVLP